MRLTCIKCGLVNPQAAGTDDSCPKCGAIYSKARPAANSGFATPSTLGPTTGPLSDYVARLRAGSQYPAFRAVAGAGALFGYIVGVLAMVGGVVAWWNVGWGIGVGSIAVGGLFVLLSKAIKEASLMLADLSDATLRMARRQEAEKF